MKNNLYVIIKIVLICALLFLIVPHFLRPKDSSVPFEQVVRQTVQDMNMDLYPQRNNQEIKRYLNLDPTQYENIAFYRTTDALNASELLIVRFKEDDQAQAFEETIKKRMASQEKIYSGYAPEQAKLVKEGVVRVEANYAIYAVGSEHAQLLSQFEESL